jgi:hypothetical protein
VPAFSLVERWVSDEVLYYRLNVMLLSCESNESAELDADDLEVGMVDGTSIAPRPVLALPR